MSLSISSLVDRILIVRSKRDAAGEETSDRYEANLTRCGARVSKCYAEDLVATAAGSVSSKFTRVVVFLSTLPRHDEGETSSLSVDTVLNMQLFTKFFEVLTPQSSLFLRINLSTDSSIRQSTIDDFSRTALYTGFVNGEEIADPAMEGTGSHEVPTGQWKEICFSCSKPNYELGAASAVPVPGDVIIDERTLISPDEPPYVPMSKGSESCADKPTACANCSCGRAELEKEVGAAEAVKRLEMGGVRSSCGNCYLGDAFRCATCPYLGKPAFKAGDKVSLDMGGDTIPQNVPPEATMGVGGEGRDHSVKLMI